MKPFEKLFRKSGSTTGNDGLTQPEREAIIDLLILGVYADNRLSLSEDATFDEMAEKMNWESPTDISYYLQTATERARAVLSKEDAETAFIEYAGERLASRTSVSQALDLLHKLLYADGKAEEENNFFKKVEGILKG